MFHVYVNTFLGGRERIVVSGSGRVKGVMCEHSHLSLSAHTYIHAVPTLVYVTLIIGVYDCDGLQYAHSGHTI